MTAARFQQDWINDLLDLVTAVEELGPIRASFSLQSGFMFDGRSQVAPMEIIDAAEAQRLTDLRRRLS